LQSVADRKAAFGPWLDSLYSETLAAVKEKVEEQGSMLGCLATDGWKKKAAEQGVPLINVNLLYPNGGSAFIKVCVYLGTCMVCIMVGRLNRCR
jgi:hypothetical protein